MSSPLQEPSPGTELALLDWKRTIFGLYQEVRATTPPHEAWRRWVEVRASLFKSHPQSPIPLDQRGRFDGPSYFKYNPRARVLGTVVPAAAERYDIATSGQETMSFRRFATASFELAGRAQRLDLYWLEGYGGGLFLPFRDATSGTQTYSAGRYLLDTVKGADLGMKGDKLVLDFNFAYNPSCAYDEAWACPLAPPGNVLRGVDLPVGERSWH